MRLPAMHPAAEKRIRTGLVVQSARILAALTLAVLLLGAAGDRRTRVSRAPGRPGVNAGGATPRLPDFALFSGPSPPNWILTDERMSEMAGAGINVATPSWLDSGRFSDNLRRYRYGADHGVRSLAWDERFYRAYFEGGGDALLDSIVADHIGEAGFLGYYFTDEPREDEFPLLARIYADLRKRDPIHPAWNSLLPVDWFADRTAFERYARDFLDATGASVLCNNHYDFLVGSDRGGFVVNAATLRAIADEYGIPFWSWVLLVEHGPYRGLDPGELRWQVSHLLAYGARGIGYFTYWTPDPDPTWNWKPAVIDNDGTRSPWYDVLVAFNPGVRAAGETLVGLVWLSTQHAGSVPRGGTAFAPDDWIRAVEGRAAIGRFAGAAGARYMLVANSDSLAAATVVLALPRTRRAWRLGDAADSWSEAPAVPEVGGVRILVALESGGFALLRLEADPAGAPGPVLAIGPNPASGAVRFAASRIAPGARLEILDAAGRPVWSSALAPNAGPLTWNGQREGGGHAGPGIYFARVTDTGGVTTARFSWLGAR